jgi:hypothetical protein
MKDVKDLKIVGLQIENLKRLVAVEIRPDGNLIQITGDNEQGKTSIFDGIWWGLDGMTNVQKRPIREGCEEALIYLDLGPIKVTRTLKLNKEGKLKNELTVASEDGAQYGSPQTLLDSFLGALTFDPLAFSRMAPKDQFDQLKTFVPGVDFDKMVQEQQADFAKRATANKEALNQRAIEASIKDAPLEEPKRVDEKVLTDRLTNSSKKNQKINEDKAAREKSFKEKVTDVLTKADEHSAKIIELTAHIQFLEKEAEQLRTQARVNADSENTQLPLEPLEDADAINKELEEARKNNAAWTRWNNKQVAKKNAEVQEDKAREFNAAMVARNGAKIKAIAEATLPVPGMTLGDGVVLLKGVPFEQASSAERIMASVRMAMAANPKLKLILIKDGSLLDKKAMEMLAQLADETGYQVWVERVEGSGKVGFVIEDGRVKAN